MKPETMMIDDVKYVREDSIQKVRDIGTKRIVVADAPWAQADAGVFSCNDHRRV